MSGVHLARPSNNRFVYPDTKWEEDLQWQEMEFSSIKQQKPSSKEQH